MGIFRWVVFRLDNVYNILLAEHVLSDMLCPVLRFMNINFAICRMSGCGTIQSLIYDNNDLVPQDLEEAEIGIWATALAYNKARFFYILR